MLSLMILPYAAIYRAVVIIPGIVTFLRMFEISGELLPEDLPHPLTKPLLLTSVDAVDLAIHKGEMAASNQLEEKVLMKA